MSLTTVTSSGYAAVAKERETPAVNLYYELHGNGPEHVILIMGKTIMLLGGLAKKLMKFI